MHLVYYDESGDDGFPAYASPLFVLSAVYCPALDWRENFDIIAGFRRQLSKDFNLPFQLEIHTRELLLNKKPYAPLQMTGAERTEIIIRFCQLAAQLSLRAISTVVIKPWIKNTQFPVLDRALSYSVNRIETDLGGSSANRFLIITDDGRVAKMRSTTRRMQKINYVPSQFENAPYKKEIRHLIEDPLPKDSRESYFIQLADMLAFLFYAHTANATGLATLPHRSPPELDQTFVTRCLDSLIPILNLKASASHPYGLVRIPNSP
jgi:Protein of unknown function (DUF3800)